MGTLECVEDSRRIVLHLHHLVGRAPSSDLRLARPEVSSAHAALRWAARGWEVRDLGSTNGTLLDGQRLAPGPWHALTAGSQLAFGHPELRWVLRSDEAPAARAVPDDGSAPVMAQNDVLSLPDSDDPEVLLTRGENGAWQVEDASGGIAPVGGSLRVRGVTWELELPEADPRTPLLAMSAIPTLTLRFRVSPDEEFVALAVQVGAALHDLGARAHHYLLLTLARLRERDAARQPTEPGEHGWVTVPQLTRMLRLEERPLNLQIFRIRKQFADLGLPHLPEVVERRRGTGQLRLGAAKVEIAGTGV